MSSSSNAFDFIPSFKAPRAARQNAVTSFRSRLITLTRLACFAALLSSFAGLVVQAQTASNPTLISDSTPAIVHTAAETGRLAGSAAMPHMKLGFSLTSTQKTDLKQLIHDQQDRSSALYHHWLTPTEFRTRFGRSPSEVALASAWLHSQGFTIDQTSPLYITFSGTSAQVESAFHTQMHQYTLGSRNFYSNSTNISLPANLATMVSGIGRLTSLRPSPMHRVKEVKALNKITPDLTTKTGTHYLVPADVQTIYDVNAVYSAGYTGAGQSIVVVGQSAIDTADIDAFHAQFGGTSNLIVTLVPFTGNSAITSLNDEEESDLDIEYAGSIAKDAIVNFVYTGQDDTAGIFDSIQYAAENNLAPVITASYGACEPNIDSFYVNFYSVFFDQAVSQGQTLIASTGDAGATGCDAQASEAFNGFAVQFPSTSPDFTAVGGTEFNEGSGTYWNSTNNADLGSATGYIPEVVWNDSDTVPLSATGGGASILYTKPDWQTGIGVPKDGARDVPDVSLDASGAHDGYFFCGPPDINGNNCADGYVYIAGGTSFAAPIFAGMVTLINHATGSTGQGDLNPLIYPMAANTAAAFHDITSGNNDSPCSSGSTDCPTGTTEIGYSAGVGYDLTTGFGSVDALLFAQAFPGYGTGATLAGSVTAITYTPTAPNAGANITFTAALSSTESSGAITGSVQFLIDGSSTGAPVALKNGTASYQSSPLISGTHIVVAEYSGDSNFAASASSISFNVAALPPTATVLTLSPAALTTGTPITVVAQTASATAGTITGTIDFQIDGNDTNNPLTLVKGAATLTVPALTAGSHTIYAQYSGNSNFAASDGQVVFNVSNLSTTPVSLSITPTSPSTADTVTATASIAAQATGSVQFLLDGVAAGTPATIASGVATTSLGALKAGNHQITANYLGDTAFAAGSSSQSIVVSSTAAAFTLSASNVTVAQNQTADSTVTVASTSDYAGTVDLALSGSGPADSCYVINSNPSITPHGTATTVVAIYTGTSCVTVPGAKRINSVTGIRAGNPPGPNNTPGSPLAPTAIVGLAGILLFRSRRMSAAMRALACIALLTVVGLATGCGGSSSSSSQPASIAGNYTLTLTGTDSSVSTNSASTTFTLTVQ